MYLLNDVIIYLLNDDNVFNGFIIISMFLWSLYIIIIYIYIWVHYGNLLCYLYGIFINIAGNDIMVFIW